MRSATSFFTLVSLLPAAFAGKRGAAWPWYNENSNLDAAKFGSSGQVSFIYNWETFTPAKKGSLQYIGMQGCYPTCDSSPIGSLASRASAWQTVFSANEPDLQGHSPAELVTWYRQNIEPLTIKKAYPAVSSSTNAGQGLDWLQQFINGCNGCFHDYINLHWYGNSFQEFNLYITGAHNRFPGEAIVVSEYALHSPASADQQLAFFRQAAPFLDGLSYVAMHFPFVSTSPTLMSANDGGAVSVVGTGSTLFNNDGSLSAVGSAINS